MWCDSLPRLSSSTSTMGIHQFIIYWQHTLCILLLVFVQHWGVFRSISELFILIPALLGLKGNLEMTLASRLSTQVGCTCAEQILRYTYFRRIIVSPAKLAYKMKRRPAVKNVLWKLADHLNKFGLSLFCYLFHGEALVCKSHRWLERRSSYA